MNVLFVCSRNRLRSPTAEAVFADVPGVEVASAGTAPDADQPVDGELLAWADLICVMEVRHKRHLTRSFSKHLRGKRMVVLGIPDIYDRMDPGLIALLEARVGPLLPHRP
jgi:predicted protein tyrosine phosphatase